MKSEDAPDHLEVSTPLSPTEVLSRLEQGSTLILPDADKIVRNIDTTVTGNHYTLRSTAGHDDPATVVVYGRVRESGSGSILSVNAKGEIGASVKLFSYAIWAILAVISIGLLFIREHHHQLRRVPAFVLLGPFVAGLLFFIFLRFMSVAPPKTDNVINLLEGVLREKISIVKQRTPKD